MKESLNTNLEQISRLISGLQEADIDLEKLTELDKSLDLLSQKIKTARLDIYSGPVEFEKQNIRQDAVFFFDREYRIIRFAGAFENIFGRGHPDNLPRMVSLMQEEDFLRLQEHTERLWETGEKQSFDSTIISKNGILLPVNVLLERVRFGEEKELISAGLSFFSGTPSDLEDYREILLENLPGIDVYLFNNEFRHVLAGGREKEKMGLSNADFNGKTLFEVFDEKTQKRLFAFYRNALDGKLSEGEVRIKKNIYFVSASPVFGFRKNVVGGAIILQDVTKEKEVEKNLIKAKREAEEADKAKSVFLANMSHEIRTPLNAIIGFTGLLNKTSMTPIQKKYTGLIAQSSEHLLSVVNEVLFLFKLGMGKVFIERVPFYSRQLIQNVEELLLFRAREKHLGLHFSVAENVPERVIGDPFRMKQILMNLVGNALKYTEKGEVNIRVFTERSTTKNVFLRFEVEDTGMGISKEDMDKIFEEFSQVGANNINVRKGAGLGLTIVRKLVDLFGGRLHVESEPGQGSVFTVVIPFIKARNKGEEKLRKEFNPDYKLLRNKRIFYVDDDENNLLLGESLFKQWETSCQMARNGSEALKWLQEEEYDIVLLDIQMPGLSGVDVVKKIRKQKQNPNRQTKMLAVTANVMERDLEHYLDSGFDDYILKPFREENLFNKICNLLDLYPEPLPEAGNTTRNEQQESEKNDFDASTLLKMAGGNHAFFNKMIDTFVRNARETAESLEKLSEEEDWQGVAQKAHKALPSFRYFGLNQLVQNLIRLERLGLHEKNYAPMPSLARETAYGIKEIVEEAQKAKIYKGEN